jgi:hypothetical protein
VNGLVQREGARDTRGDRHKSGHGYCTFAMPDTADVDANLGVDVDLDVVDGVGGSDKRGGQIKEISDVGGR